MALRQLLKSGNIQAIGTVEVCAEMRRPPRVLRDWITVAKDRSWWSDSVVLAFSEVPIPQGVRKVERQGSDEEPIKKVCESLERSVALRPSNFVVAERANGKYTPNDVLVALRTVEQENAPSRTILVSWARLGELWAEGCTIVGTSSTEPIFVFKGESLRGLVMPCTVREGTRLVPDLEEAGHGSTNSEQ